MYVRFVPSINKDLCNKCGLCFDLCAGKGNDWYNQSIELNNDIKDSYVQNVGLYRESYISNAVDYETRFHGASGGTVSSLLIFMLENKIIDGAIVTQFKKTNPLEVETIIATSKEEILNAKSSKYCPVHMDSILTQLKEFKGKVAIVGLPCHLQTIRRIERKLSWVKDKIVFHIGLFCSGSKDSNALNYLLKSNKFDINGITKFSYRDDGCLGYVKAEYTNKSISVPYEQAYSKLHSYFKQERCLSCIGPHIRRLYVVSIFHAIKINSDCITAFLQIFSSYDFFGVYNVSFSVNRVLPTPETSIKANLSDVRIYNVHLFIPCIIYGSK